MSWVCGCGLDNFVNEKQYPCGAVRQFTYGEWMRSTYPELYTRQSSEDRSSIEKTGDDGEK